VPKFIEILPKFLTNQNFWGCTCTPCTPTSYTTDGCNWYSWTWWLEEVKSEVSDGSLLFLLLVTFLLVLVNAPNCHLSLVLGSVVQGDAVNCNTLKWKTSSCLPLTTISRSKKQVPVYRWLQQSTVQWPKLKNYVTCTSLPQESMK